MNNSAFDSDDAAVVARFRANGGDMGAGGERFKGVDGLLLLTSVGAKSGQSRLSPLAYFRIDGKLLIIGSSGGGQKNPGWVHNLRANPRAHIEIGSDAYAVDAREVLGAERDDLYGKVASLAQGFADFQAGTTRILPMFELISHS